MASDPTKKVANTLMVVSSAAVLAVFSAGYVRTQPAADRVARQALVRESVPQVQPRATPPAAKIPVPETVAMPVAAPAPIVHHAANHKPKLTPAHEKPQSVEVAESHVAPYSAPEQPAPPVEAPSEPVAPAEPAAVNPVVEQPAESPAAPPAQASSKAIVWKDGKYSGWGSCFHGDLEATVVVQGGRIASAVISQCLTRYDCDVISKLPPEVVTRQTANVDRISGATQSSDAFYFAVMDALNKAK